MLNEEDVLPESRYLFCNYTLDNYNLGKIKEDVVRFIKDRDEDQLYKSFLKWEEKANELAVVTMYAYADFKIPKLYNIIFDLANPDNYIQVDFEIIISVFNGYAPISEISHGHKHVCVLKFKEVIPPIFNLIIPFQRDWPKHKTTLGFCMSEDFPAIRERLSSPREIEYD